MEALLSDNLLRAGMVKQSFTKTLCKDTKISCTLSGHLENF